MPSRRYDASPSGYTRSFADRLAEMFESVSDASGVFGKYLAGSEEREQQRQNQALQRLFSFKQLESLDADRAFKHQERADAVAEKRRLATEKVDQGKALAKYLGLLSPHDEEVTTEVPETTQPIPYSPDRADRSGSASVRAGLPGPARHLLEADGGMPPDEPTLEGPAATATISPAAYLKQLVRKQRSPIEAGAMMGPEAAGLPPEFRTELLKSATELRKPLSGAPGTEFIDPTTFEPRYKVPFAPKESTRLKPTGAMQDRLLAGGFRDLEDVPSAAYGEAQQAAERATLLESAIRSSIGQALPQLDAGQVSSLVQRIVEDAQRTMTGGAPAGSRVPGGTPAAPAPGSPGTLQPGTFQSPSGASPKAGQTLGAAKAYDETVARGNAALDVQLGMDAGKWIGPGAAPVSGKLTQRQALDSGARPLNNAAEATALRQAKSVTKYIAQFIPVLELYPDAGDSDAENLMASGVAGMKIYLARKSGGAATRIGALEGQIVRLVRAFGDTANTAYAERVATLQSVPGYSETKQSAAEKLLILVNELEATFDDAGVEAPKEYAELRAQIEPFVRGTRPGAAGELSPQEQQRLEELRRKRGQ
jgi:hypothetical protein